VAALVVAYPHYKTPVPHSLQELVTTLEEEVTDAV